MRVINSIKSSEGTGRDDFKPMPVVGKGVEEIRVSDPSGAYLPQEDTGNIEEGS